MSKEVDRLAAAGPDWLDCGVTDEQASDDSLRLRIRIDAPADTAFKALTDADTITDWLAESAEVSLEDNRYEFWGRYTPRGDRPRQQLLTADSPTVLRFSWTFDGDSGPVESIVDIGLADTGDGGTEATITHSGIGGLSGADRRSLECFWPVSLANLAAQCEGLPTMPPFDFSVPASGDALVRTVIDVGPDEVYASLLDPAQVDKWAGGKASIEPEVGGRYEFGWDHGPGRILELEPDKTIAYSWSYPDSPDTVVKWSLRSSRGSTYLTLLHSGFDNDELAEQYRQGWPGFLVEIKRILELGDQWVPLHA
jgi:uncharacterized protein YndB with AHSA1/START domain